jgi:phage terminase large subunit GpA-like protein
LASKWIIAKDDPETKQTFYNTQLGLPFHSEALANIETHELAKRREKFAADGPAGVLVLTAGLDVQPGSDVSIGRIECEVVGWGLGEESWSITYKVFNGNPGEPEIWNEVDAFLLSQFSCEHGGKMVIRAACIDTGGHNTQDVYNFARPRMPRNVWAIKGASDKSGQWSPVWPVPKLQKGKFRQTGYRPVILGVNAAKEYIRNKLLITNPGPGFMHFPAERAEAWFDQLTAERLQIEKKAGVTIRKWVPVSKGVANEALDCRVYAYGALCGLYAVRKLNLERLAAAMDNYRHPPLNVESPAPAPASAPTPARVVSPVVSRPRPQRVRRSSFMG